MKVVVIVLVLTILISGFFLFGENLPDYEPDQEYEPYQEDEFPKWARDLRRGEIIFFGTIPFSFFYATFSYDLYRYASSNFDESYAPAIFGNTTPSIRTNDEKWQILNVSLTISAVLTLLDYLLGQPWND